MKHHRWRSRTQTKLDVDFVIQHVKSHHHQLVKSYQSVFVNGCDDEHSRDFIKSGFEEIFIPPEGSSIDNRTLLIKSELIILSVAICRLFVDFSCSNFFLEAVFCSSNSSRWVLGFFPNRVFLLEIFLKNQTSLQERQVAVGVKEEPKLQTRSFRDRK